MISFTKAHACGNDFLVVDGAAVAGAAREQVARRLCARTTGIGADGVEFLTLTGDRAGRIRLHNADGSLAEISGNGTRCVAAFVAHRAGFGAGDVVSLETDAGMRHCRVEHVEGARFLISSGMGVPRIGRKTVTLRDGTRVEGAAVSTGNPHFVIVVDDDSFSHAGRCWEDLGAEICRHVEFPEETNVEFVRMLTPEHIAIRIFERGVGPTASSGTGTTATAAVAIALHGAARSLKVTAPGGMQEVHWRDPEGELVLTGPAELITSGQVLLDLGEPQQ